MGKKTTFIAVVSMLILLIAVPIASAAVGVDTSKLRDAVTVYETRDHQKEFQKIANRNNGIRSPGTSGYDESVEYVAEQLEASDYFDVEVQESEISSWEEFSTPVLEQLSPLQVSYPPNDLAGFFTMTPSGSGDVTATVEPVDLILPPGDAAGTSTSGCEVADFADFTSGNIALIQRGSCLFTTKAQNAEAAGATGVIIFNEGQPERTDAFKGSLTEPVPTVPVVGTAFAVGEELSGGGATVHIFVDAGFTSKTVSTDVFYVAWSETNPEKIIDIRWNGSFNLTRTAVIGGCPDDLEFFGNSWVSQDEGTSEFVFRSLVGWGTTGEWENRGSNKIKIQSSSAGCPGSVDIPVKTDYQFFDRGPRINTIRVRRSFSFGSTPFPFNFRPYIPRLHSILFTQVIHPDASGTALMTESIDPCGFGCEVTDWGGTWFAIHDPSSGRGVIVNRRSSPFTVALWVDQDGATSANTSSVLLIQPSGGFIDKVVEDMSLCFYDAGIWTPSLTLPPGC